MPNNQTDHIDEAGEYNPADLENIKLPEDSEKIKMRHNPPNQTDPLDAILTNYVRELDSEAPRVSEKPRAAAKAALNAEIAKARLEGAEMCHNALFHGSASNNGIIELDTGETAIRYNNLIAELTTPEEGKENE